MESSDARPYTRTVVRRPLRIVSVVALAFGCAAPPVPPYVPPDPVTRTYVISTMDVDGDYLATPPRAHGLDLDGMVGGDPALPCTGGMDYASMIDGAPGVDNEAGPAFAAIGSTLGPDGLDGLLRTEIQSGRSLVLEVSGIDDLVEDSSVEVRLWVVAAPPRGPEFDGPGLAPGQTFRRTTDLGGGPGLIVGGRLHGGEWTVPIAFDFQGRRIVLLVHDARITGDVSDGDGVALGELGGVLLVDEVTAMWMCTVCGPESDISPQADGRRCDGFSVGIGFTAVPALLTE